MAWRDEAEQGLPPQRHREPATLRQDILDELADHLSLAAEREAEAGARGEQELRTRVLNNFGDPAAVARTLWWDAMKETVMKDWIQISINAVLCLAVVGFMALIYGQMQSTNTALLNALNDRPAGVENLNPSIEFILHRGSVKGPAAAGIRISLEGSAFSDEKTSIREVSDDRGRAKFGPIRPGRYKVRLSDAMTGLRFDEDVTVYSGDGLKSVRIPVPPDTPAPLNVTAPATVSGTNDVFRLTMLMETRWNHEGSQWRGYPRGVIVASDGLFRAEKYSRDDAIVRPLEPIIQTYGNQLRFTEMRIAKPYIPQEGGDGWLRQLASDHYFERYQYSYIDQDLRPEGQNSIVLDLSDGLVEACEYHLRMAANEHHGLDEQFSWFPEIVSLDYPDYVIEEARLVKESLEIHSSDSGYILYPGYRGEFVSREDAQVLSMENVPKNIPAGHRLMLAFQSRSDISRGSLNDRGVNLCAYLDTSPARFDIEKLQPIEWPPQLPKPIWKIAAGSIEVEWQRTLHEHPQSGGGRRPSLGYAALIDLTNAINNDPSFQDATGILFRWETPSANRFRILSPERAAPGEQPVWLILKPVGDDAVSNTNAG